MRQQPKRATVLVVDDAVDYLQGCSILLQHYGFDVIAASSGEEALQQLAKRTPDAIVTDYMMPGMNGVELCRRIRSLPHLKRAPVILMSAVLSREPERDGCFDDYIRKDGFLQIVDRLANHLKGRH